MVVPRDLARKPGRGIPNNIRSLASSGMTMVIVTHQMRFARSISNRVFYMDEGGVYEEGTPEQIFGSPRRERTRRFMHRLKTVELSVTDADSDYGALIAQIERFAQDAALLPQEMRRLMLLFEEITFQCVLPAVREGGCELPLTVRIEHSEEEGVSLRASWGGVRFDPLTQGDEMSRSLIAHVSESARWRYEGGNVLDVSL